MAEANGALVSLYVRRNNAIKNKGDVAGLNAEINKYVKDNEVPTAVRRASSAAASNVQSNSKAAMMRGGMANKKEHNYAAGGMVSDGLKALKASGPKGLEAYKKITGK